MREVRNAVESLLQSVHDRCSATDAGAVADYIPELASADPERFGIALATTQGNCYEVGDADASFTLQSISKPFTYALALADRGLDAVAARIDVEPSGEPFNEISLDPATEHPRNPMINAGAITAASLVSGRGVDERFSRVLDTYSRYAGRELRLDERVYRSEARTGFRNRAIAYMLRSFDILEADPDDALDVYFRQCSVELNCRDLAAMAATLANNGVNPRTGERVLAAPLVERVLSVMTTCGMYDGSGAWVAEVGLPAKSGVSGGVLAVLPGQLGIAAFSPRLDPHGNSVRGVRACRVLSRKLELHFMHVPHTAHTAIRAAYSVTATPSRKRRTATERASLESFGARGRVIELFGDLLFSGAETVAREIAALDPQVEALVLDLRRVGDLAAVSAELLREALASLTAVGVHYAVVDPRGVLIADSPVADADAPAVFDDLDTASQWCEDRLLDTHCTAGRQVPMLRSIADHPLLAGLDEDSAHALLDALEPRAYPPGEFIVRRGDDPDGLFLIVSGEVSQLVSVGTFATLRVTTLSAGMTFGEPALLAAGPFLTDIRADTAVSVQVLPRERFEEFTRRAPELRTRILQRVVVDAQGQMDSALRALAVRAAGL